MSIDTLAPTSLCILFDMKIGFEEEENLDYKLEALTTDMEHKCVGLNISLGAIV